jgi:GDP-L-fucose synthase
MSNFNQKIYVAGHQGMVGSAILRSLKDKGYSNIIGHTHKELDLTNQADVQSIF